MVPLHGTCILDVVDHSFDGIVVVGSGSVVGVCLVCLYGTCVFDVMMMIDHGSRW